MTRAERCLLLACMVLAPLSCFALALLLERVRWRCLILAEKNVVRQTHAVYVFVSLSLSVPSPHSLCEQETD